MKIDVNVKADIKDIKKGNIATEPLVSIVDFQIKVIISIVFDSIVSYYSKQNHYLYIHIYINYGNVAYYLSGKFEKNKQPAKRCS